MSPQRLLQDEEGRIRELRELELLDSDSEPSYENLTQLASELCGVETAIISLVDADRVWFKAATGTALQQLEPGESFCSFVVRQGTPLVLSDARTDPRFADHPQVRRPDGYCFYAGVPLITHNGYAIGSLCVIADKPHYLSETQIGFLHKLAAQVIVVVELRRSNIRLRELERRSSQSEQRLSFALQAARLGDFSRNLQTDVSVRSLQHDVNFGYAERLPEWSYATFLSHVDARDRDAVVAAFNHAKATQTDYDVEFRVRWPDGSLHWLWTRGRFSYDAHGHALSVSGIQGDITARKQSEIALSVSNERYQLLFQHSMDAIMQTTLEGCILFANPAACQLFGCTEADLRNEGRSRVVKATDPRLDALLEQRLKDGFAHGQLTMVKWDGTEFEAEISSNVYADQDGVAMTSMVIVDITSRLQAETALRAQHSRTVQLEAQHRGLLQNLNTGIVLHRPDTAIIFCNKRACDLLGLEEAQLLGKTALPNEWHFLDESEAFLPVADYPVNRVLAHGQPVEELVLGVPASGNHGIRWLQASAFPERDEQGELRHVVVNFHDITQRKKAELASWMEANYDHLTGLPNRRLFHDRLSQEMRQAQRDRSQLALLFLDLDRFKDVNDSLGHDVGDLLLVEAARRIQSCIRERDTLARLGGDEFTVVLAGLHSVADIAAIAAKIINALSQPFELNCREILVTVSIGVAQYPSDALSAVDLVKHADQAMYVAKNAGRACYRFFTKNMQAAAESKMQLAADLRLALRDRQFSLAYQPIVHLATGDVYKAEALLRWNHPTQGAISPAVFIPIAEDSGVIHEIGDWVFAEAAQQVKHWRGYQAGFQISVNKSPVQFAAADERSDRWIAQLAAMGLPGQCITVEITEGLLMNQNATVTDQLLKYRDAGMQVAIDDFGTGYSSLSYLKKFDIDYLKIDQSFIRNLGVNTPDLALCEAIVVMAHKLGLQVIAEGVETAEQRDWLHKIGCDYAQGYFYARPMPAHDFEKYLGLGATPAVSPPLAQ